MDTFISTKSFLEDQIKILNVAFKINKDFDDIISPTGTNDDKEYISLASLNKILLSINQKQKQYYFRLFTQQATNYVARRVQSVRAARLVEAQDELAKAHEALFTSADSKLAAFKPSSLNGMTDSQILDLSNLLIQASTNSDGYDRNYHKYRSSISRLKEAINKQKTAKIRNKQIRDKLEMVERVFGDGSVVNETLTKNIPNTTTTSLTDELTRLNELINQLNNTNDSELKRGLEVLQREEEAEEPDDDSLAKRQKFIISNELDI